MACTNLVVDERRRRFELFKRNEQILNYVMTIVNALDGRRRCQLEQRDFRRHRPAEQVAAENIVAERNEILKKKVC